MTKVKICGIKDFPAAAAAVVAGADFVGFVFVPNVRRRVEVRQAREIISQIRELPAYNAKTKFVGLFANQPLPEVNRIARNCAIDLVQLSGEESLDFCSQVEKPVIKVIRIQDTEKSTKEVTRSTALELEIFGKSDYICTLDKHQQGAFGGTGRAFNWAIAKELAHSYQFILAGGLNPINVHRAIQQVNPWGVDVSSGVETDQKKDLNKIASFLLEAHQLKAT